VHPSRPGWRIAGYVATVVVLGVAVVIWFSVLREVKAPVSSGESVSRGRPSAAECAELIAGMTKPSDLDQRVTPEVRDRFRQCFDRR